MWARRFAATYCGTFGSSMATGTKIRQLSRLLDSSETPLWAIGPDGRLAYLSSGCATWLGIDPEALVDRRSIAGVPVSDDPLDQLAASLSPPPGIAARGTASLKIQPRQIGEHRGEPLEVRFLRVGQGDASLTIAVAGSFNDRAVDEELKDAVAVRQRLDAWRKRHAGLATIATAGDSAAARRMRRRLRVAAATRCDVGFFGPPGSGLESVAARIHQLSAAAEEMVTVDGPLMDAELLDATLMPLAHLLADSQQARATAIVRGLDEMPFEAQLRLANLLETYSGRLRLLAVCGPRPATLHEALDTPSGDELDAQQDESNGICMELIETLSALSVTTEPLASRVEDIPMIATAMLDALHASGETSAERLSRAALDALVIYPWPRNVDELADAIRHAGTRANASSISVEHLPLAIRSYRPGETTQPKHAGISLDDAVQRYELKLIRDALEDTDGNRAEAARRLGISRARLIRRVDENSEDQTAK